MVDESRWVLPEDSAAKGNVLKVVDEGGMQILLEDELLKLV